MSSANDELRKAEEYAFFSGFDLDVNQVYPLSDPSFCKWLRPSLPLLLPHHSQKSNIMGLAQLMNF